MSATPEFIRWSLERVCPIRDFDDGSNPERTDRQLRALHCYDDAVAEGRLVDGVCLARDAATAETPLGFRVDDVLTTFGGWQRIVECCSTCPANATPNRVARCFGWFELSAIGDELPALIDRAVASAAMNERLAKHFLVTRPLWYGLWVFSPLTPEQLACHDELAAALTAIDSRLVAALQDWRAALDAARRSALRLWVSLFPAGQVIDRRWLVPAHCERCRSPRDERFARRPCPVCGLVKHPVAARKRHVVGTRPFRPLREFLNETDVTKLLGR